MIQIHLDLKDKEYQATLGKHLALLGGTQREICLHHFADAQERAEFLSRQNKQKNLWLISPEYAREVEYTNTLRMTDAPTEEIGECFCYQPISRIQKQVTEMLYACHMIERISERADATEYIYLYSPFGGIGVSTLAYTLANRLAQREKVLLVSLDAYHSFENEFVAFRLSDLLFYWETLNEVNISDFCHKKGNLHILYGPKSPEDLGVLKARSKKEFLEILTAGGYTKIVVDLSSSGMELWCRPEDRSEKLFVIQRMADKWKQFSVAADFAYIAIPEEDALTQIQEALRGDTDVDEVLPADHRRDQA